MCMIKQDIRGRGQDFAVDFYCEKTAKPITIANEHGMYCVKLCGIKEDKAIKSVFRNKLDTILESIEW